MAKLFENPRSIAIEGPIRAGKSTLATLLAQEIGAARIVEPQQNPFLPQFYRGERSAAFPAQMWFLMPLSPQLSRIKVSTEPDRLSAWALCRNFRRAQDSQWAAGRIVD